MKPRVVWWQVDNVDWFKLKVQLQSTTNKMKPRVVFSTAVFLTFLRTGTSIKCYQCASTEDQKPKTGLWWEDQNREQTGVWSKDIYTQDRFEDQCGVYWPFLKERNIPVECNSDESHTPGTFCVKIVRQGPRGFIWDGRWRMVIRRCASVSDTGVTGVCNWGVLENGVYWEECYCSHDACNGSSRSMIFISSLLPLLLLLLLLR